MVTKVETLREGHIRCTGIGRTAEKNYTSHANIWNPGYKSMLETERHLADATRKGEVMAVSDGSFKDWWVTAALIIEGNNQGNHIIEASCTNTGLPRYQDSYRSDLSGIIHVVKIVGSLTSKFNITEGSINLGCNGLYSIQIDVYQLSSFSCTSNQFEILTEIHKIV